MDKSELIEKLEKGIFLRDASGRLAYEISNIPSDRYLEIREILVAKFKLIPFGFTINSLEDSWRTYIKGFRRLGIEWDDWSGFIIVAKNKRSEKLVYEMGQFLESNEKI